MGWGTLLAANGKKKPWSGFELTWRPHLQTKGWNIFLQDSIFPWIVCLIRSLGGYVEQSVLSLCDAVCVPKFTGLIQVLPCLFLWEVARGCHIYRGLWSRWPWYCLQTHLFKTSFWACFWFHSHISLAFFSSSMLSTLHQCTSNAQASIFTFTEQHTKTHIWNSITKPCLFWQNGPYRKSKRFNAVFGNVWLNLFLRFGCIAKHRCSPIILFGTACQV